MSFFWGGFIFYAPFFIPKAVYFSYLLVFIVNGRVLGVGSVGAGVRGYDSYRFFFGGSYFSFYVILKDTGDITGNGVRASWFRFVLSFPILFYPVLGRMVFFFFVYWGNYSYDGYVGQLHL